MYTSEFKFILACIRSDFDKVQREQALTGIPLICDWNIVIKLALHHGLIPLLYTRLKSLNWLGLPVSAISAFEISHRANASHALSLTNELMRLVTLLNSNNIFALPYKGPALALQLYGDVAMRQYGDIDVLVHLSDFSRVAELMSENGWNKKYDLDSLQLQAYTRRYNDYYFFSQPKGILFEIHWEIGAKAYAFPLSLAEIKNRVNRIQLSNTSVPAISPEDLILILSFHGATHLWERLSWLVDIAQILHIYPNLNWKWIHQRASELRCHHILYFSLFLIQSFLQQDLPPFVKGQIAEHQAAVKLGESIEKKLTQNPFWVPNLWEKAFFHIKMREGWKERFQYIFYTLFRVSQEDWVSIPVSLPPALFFLYYPVRLWRVFRRHILQNDR